MTERIEPTPAGIARAAALLRAGSLVAFGTETVYGLGADATNAQAVARIFEAKQRPRFNPLICHYPDADAAFADVEPNKAARRLASAFWPGPLTLVLKRRQNCPVALLTGAGLPTLGVRVPAHPVALELIRAAERPIAAPSANRSGQVSPTMADHVLKSLSGRIAAVLDSGPCKVGLESTVVDLTGPHAVLLRPGGTTEEAIAAITGPVQRASLAPSQAVEQDYRSPGLLASHYAPRLPVRLDADHVGPNEALLAFGVPLSGAAITFNLSREGDLTEAAAHLFAGLHWLDAEGVRLGLAAIAAMPIPDRALGVAIYDRLQRAAAPRS
jgi:L-threonylcarbamoyladenylate synthase